HDSRGSTDPSLTRRAERAHRSASARDHQQALAVARDRIARGLALNAGALARLELPAVRALLAERTAFAPGRELAEALAPTADPREAERLHDETAAARHLLPANPSTGLRGARDIRDPLRRARLADAPHADHLDES